METLLISLGIGVVLFFVLNKKQPKNTSIPTEEPPVFGTPIIEDPKFDNNETVGGIEEPIVLTENEV